MLCACVDWRSLNTMSRGFQAEIVADTSAFYQHSGLTRSIGMFIVSVTCGVDADQLGRKLLVAGFEPELLTSTSQRFTSRFTH